MPLAGNHGYGLLWTGIADPEKARPTVDHLMSSDMFDGWGIRTLSSLAHSYNPSGYHIGSVWPFDNALIAAGFRRYGFDQAARAVILAMFQAARFFDVYRLPELFSGFERDEYEVPVHYPVACHPQAWSAAALPLALTSLLGLVPDGFAHKLYVVRPMLPEEIGPVEIRSLAITGARVDLRFTPADSGPAGVRVVSVDGELDVEVVSEGQDFDF